MNYSSSRPLQARNRNRSPARSATVSDDAAPAPTSAGNVTPGGQTRHYGPAALAGNAGNFERALTSKPGSFLRKLARSRLKQLLARPSGQSLAALIDRRVEEKLAQRLPPPSIAVVTARARGDAWAREEYAKPENLTLDQAAELAGVSTRIINERRNDGKYYALLPAGQQRGYRFPRWQFDAPGERLAAVLQITSAAGVSAWGVHIFMISSSSHLAGSAPRDCIANPACDLEVVLQLARARFTSDQGAG